MPEHTEAINKDGVYSSITRQTAFPIYNEENYDLVQLCKRIQVRQPQFQEVKVIVFHNVPAKLPLPASQRPIASNARDEAVWFIISPRFCI